MYMYIHTYVCVHVVSLQGQLYNSLTSDVCQVNISECQVNFADA